MGDNEILNEDGVTFIELEGAAETGVMLNETDSVDAAGGSKKNGPLLGVI